MDKNLNTAIMQPTFNPWLGYFDLIDNSEIFIFLDTVQISHPSWQTRNKIKVANTEYYISIPIQKIDNRFETLIKNAQIDKEFNYKRTKIIKTLEREYKKSTYFEEVYDFVKDLLFYETVYLSDFNINIITSICKKINITSQIIKASDIKDIGEKKALLILEICKKTNTRNYYSPWNSYEYMKEHTNKFNEDKINVFFQNYKHPIYPQIGKTFIPFLGIFDLLFNCGFNNSLEIIRKGRNFERRE